MRRREFIVGLGAAAALSVVGRAQSGQVRLIAILAGTQNDAATRTTLAALREGLVKLGWIEGRNLRIEQRFAGFDVALAQIHAAELVGLAPDVIVATNAPTTRALQEQTKTIPIVFTAGSTPIEAGFVGSLARPGTNITGFANLYPSIAGKWLELLKEVAPTITRVILVYDGSLRLGLGAEGVYVPVIEKAATALGVRTINAPVRNGLEIARAIDAFAAEPNGGLILLPPPLGANSEIVYQLAIQHRLPAIYSNRPNVLLGGLMSYGSDFVDTYRRAASYVDRILRGEKAGDLPVQYPTKFELVINLTTAKAIGLTIPESFLLRVDEVIE